MRLAVLQILPQSFPGPARPLQSRPRDQQAEIGAAILDRLQTGIAVGEHDDLDMPHQRLKLARRELQMKLEPDQILGRPRRLAAEAAQIVLASGEEQGGCPHRAHAGDFDRNRLAAPHRRNHVAAPDLGAAGCGARQQRLVQHAARQPGGPERQRRLDHIRTAHQAQAGDRVGPQRGQVDAEALQIHPRLDADEFAADLVHRRRLALDQHDAPAVAGQQAGSGGAGEPAARDDHRMHYFRRPTQRRNGMCQRTRAATPASASSRVQSARRKLRATEIVPSMRMMRCQRTIQASTRKP